MRKRGPRSGGRGLGFQMLDDSGEALAHLTCGFKQLRVFDSLHRRDRINSRYLAATVLLSLDHDVAGEHGPHLVFELQRLVRQSGVAGPQDGVRTEIDADLRLQRLLDVDPADDKPSSLRAASVCLIASSKGACNVAAM